MRNMDYQLAISRNQLRLLVLEYIQLKYWPSRGAHRKSQKTQAIAKSNLPLKTYMGALLLRTIPTQCTEHEKDKHGGYSTTL